MSDSNDAHVFLSYSDRDSKAADAIARELTKHELKVLRHRDVDVGASFRDELGKLIERAQVVVALMSPAFFDSRWTDWEVHFTLARNIPLVPALIERCAVQGILTNYQFADLTADREAGIERMVEGVEHWTNAATTTT